MKSSCSEDGRDRCPRSFLPLLLIHSSRAGTVISPSWTDSNDMSKQQLRPCYLHQRHNFISASNRQIDSSEQSCQRQPIKKIDQLSHKNHFDHSEQFPKIMKLTCSRRKPTKSLEHLSQHLEEKKTQRLRKVKTSSIGQNLHSNAHQPRSRRNDTG